MYKRIILKLSGETLAAEKTEGVTCVPAYNEDRVNLAADAIMSLAAKGIQLGIVIGGGNIWRGRASVAMNNVAADQMGMLATVMNALCVADAIVRKGGKATVFTAQEMNRFAQLYTRDAALEKLEQGHIVLLAGGSGNPFFTTDTAAALRAAELDADAVFKGTTVDGVYDKDPRKDPDAKLIKDVTYDECIEKGYKVMDTTAFLLCKEQKVPCIRVFNMDDLNNILRVAEGDDLGTIAHM